MPSVANGGVYLQNGIGYDLPRQDGVFNRTILEDRIKLKEHSAATPITSNLAYKLNSMSKGATKRLLPTLSNPAIQDISDSVLTSGYSYPNYAATDAATFTQTNPQYRTATSGDSVLGIPFTLQAPNEGVVELNPNQLRGGAMLFTRRYLDEITVPSMKNPSMDYGDLFRQQLAVDLETYCWLTFLYTGPVTATAGDYGTGVNSFTDAIGLTNRANYALTRVLTSINGASNLITPNSDTSNAPTSGMSNGSNARFPNSVPRLFGSSASPITFDVIQRAVVNFRNQVGANITRMTPMLITNPKAYMEIAMLPQFSNADFGAQNESAYQEGVLRSNALSLRVLQTTAIQPAGSSSNAIYSVFGAKGASQELSSLVYDTVGEPEVIMDNMLKKKEMAYFLGAFSRYGAVLQRPTDCAVIVSAA